MYRKDMPVSKSGCIKVCCWTIKSSDVAFDPPVYFENRNINNMAFDEVCGISTKKRWDEERQEYVWDDLCEEHKLAALKNFVDDVCD